MKLRDSFDGFLFASYDLFSASFSDHVLVQSSNLQFRVFVGLLFDCDCAVLYLLYNIA